MLPERTSYRAARRAARAALVGVAVLIASACDEPGRATSPPGSSPPDPRFTAGQGSTPTFIGQATYADFDKVKRIADHWQVELKAKGGMEVVVRSFSYAPGSYTGWHKHPGPVLIQVVEGTVTFFEADHPCTPIVVHAGEGYVDTGEQGHIGRNLSGAPARDVTIYLAPPGTQVSQLRIDMPAPAGADACS